MTNLLMKRPADIFPGYAFKDIRDIKLYPSIGMKRPQAHVDVNFGQRPFNFDIDGHVNVPISSTIDLPQQLTLLRTRKQAYRRTSVPPKFAGCMPA